jgi:DNA-binding XRE family transcriptional regulator
VHPTYCQWGFNLSKTCLCSHGEINPGFDGVEAARGYSFDSRDAYPNSGGPWFRRKGMSQRLKNAVQRLREEQLLSKAELARRAGVSVLTIDRVERGSACRVDTKRKIILALGMNVAERKRVFFEDDAQRR